MGNKPMYRQIADAFREKINAGELKPGDALPTESSLHFTERTDVSLSYQ